MGLAGKLMDRVVDRLLEKETGHRFVLTLEEKRANLAKYKIYETGLCANGCGAHCLDVLDQCKAGKAKQCPKKPVT
jgi:hypothetical protein